MDLILLVKTVRMEADIWEHQSTLDRSDVLIQNKRRMLVHNPLLAAVDNLERRQLLVIRSMSQSQLSSDPRVINGLAKKRTQARISLHDIGSDGLIEMPAHYVCLL